MLWLLRCHTADPQALLAAAQRWTQDAGRSVTRAAWSAPECVAYVYAHPAPTDAAPGAAPDAALPDAAVPTRESASFAALCPQATQVQVSRLVSVFASPGHSSTAQPRYHYIVETDPESGWHEELHRWYNTEHMPGLAGVPGCIRTQRLHNRDHGPLSLACYDLTHPQVLESPEWLAVRGTAWSSRVRPHFTHTRRTMLEVLA